MRQFIRVVASIQLFFGLSAVAGAIAEFVKHRIVYPPEKPVYLLPILGVCDITSALSFMAGAGVLMALTSVVFLVHLRKAPVVLGHRSDVNGADA